MTVEAGVLRIHVGKTLSSASTDSQPTPAIEALSSDSQTLKKVF